MIFWSTRRLSPALAWSVLTVPSRAGAQHVLHLHRLDHGQRLARLDLLPFVHRDRGQQARHRRQQELRRVGRRLDRHQRVELGLARRQHQHIGLAAVVDEAPTRRPRHRPARTTALPSTLAWNSGSPGDQSVSISMRRPADLDRRSPTAAVTAAPSGLRFEHDDASSPAPATGRCGCPGRCRASRSDAVDRRRRQRGQHRRIARRQMRPR